MNKTSQKQKFIYTLLLVVCVSYVEYMMLISNSIQSIKSLKSDCEQLNNELVELQSYVVNKERYLKQIKDNNSEIISITDSFLPYIKNQDFIAYAQYLDDEFEMSTNIVTFDSNNNEIPISYVFDSDRSDTSLISRQASLTYSIKYNDLKEYFKRIKESDMMVYIDSMSASMDSSTNLLNGTIVFNARAITSSLKNDDTFDVNDIKTGVDNIFGEYNEDITINNMSEGYDVVDIVNN